MKSVCSRILKMMLALLAFPILAFLCLISKRSKAKPRLFFGPVPIINNKYWSAAMQEAGYVSRTVMHSCYRINSKEDYDLYFEEFIPSFPSKLKPLLKPAAPYFVFAACIRNFDIFHIPFSGGVLGATPLKRLEAFLLKLAHCKVVCLPYGSDAYVYDEIRDLSLKHALLTSYPAFGKESRAVKENILYWSKHADIIVQGFMVDSFPRWDVLAGSFVAIDAGSWRQTKNLSSADGLNGPVRVSHSPNHRGCKGTEYLIDAVKRLSAEGYLVELILLEGKKNHEVREILQNQADIHCDQLIIPGYGLSAIEGMAVGLPVLANLESEEYLRVFRRFSFLNRCPVVSASPETVYQKLKILISDPALRKRLGEEGTDYVRQFHSYRTAQYLFGSIYKKIWYREDVNIMHLFHPLNSSYPDSGLGEVKQERDAGSFCEVGVK